MLFSLRNSPYKVCYYQEDLLYQSICLLLARQVLLRLASAAMFSNQISFPPFFRSVLPENTLTIPNSTFIHRLDIPASTFYSALPNSGILLRSTIGGCSCLHATTFSLPPPIHHLYQNFSRDVNTFIVQTRGGHDQHWEATGSSVVKTSWRPANER